MIGGVKPRRRKRQHVAREAWSHGTKELSADAGGHFGNFFYTVLQISVLSLGWVFFEHVAAWFKARVSSKGGDLRGVGSVGSPTQAGQPTAGQGKPPGFWSTTGGPAAAGTTGQRDFAEFR